MAKCLIATVLFLTLVRSSFASDLCITTSANDRNLSFSCNSLGIPTINLYQGYGETFAESCSYTGCPNPGGDCGCGMTGPYQWYISRSSTDPYDYYGPLSSNELYLWLDICNLQQDWLIAEFALDGSLEVQSFVPTSGFVNSGTATELLLYSETCVTADTHLVGTIHLGSAVPVPGELQSGTWGRTKAGYAD